MKAKKVTFSLSPTSASLLDAIAKKEAGGNASLVADAAIIQLGALDTDTRERLFSRLTLERGITTRDAWQRAFWRWLARGFAEEDRLGNAFAPRCYGEYMVVFLLKGAGQVPNEGDMFHIHVTPTVDVNNGKRYTWDVPRNALAADTADVVAEWIKQNSLLNK